MSKVDVKLASLARGRKSLDITVSSLHILSRPNPGFNTSIWTLSANFQFPRGTGKSLLPSTDFPDGLKVFPYATSKQLRFAVPLWTVGFRVSEHPKPLQPIRGANSSLACSPRCSTSPVHTEPAPLLITLPRTAWWKDGTGA